MKSFFISSTFKDMQAERDVLHERVFPVLRRVIKEYGDEVQEVDLRWGVDTVNMSEEESGHEVLRICIDAIDRCKPYIIVLLGERYGWIPGSELVNSVDDTRISDRYQDDMSVTELEIQYGALLREDSFERCVFCFRDPSVNSKIDAEERHKYDAESPRHAKRLTALKNQIRSLDGAVIMDYSADWDSEEKCICGLEDFEAQIYSLLEEMIRRDYADKKQKTLKEKYVDEVELIKNEYLSSYVRRYPEEFAIIKQIGDFEWNTYAVSSQKELDCLVVRGSAGSGKSALMAFVANKTAESKANAILCFASASGCRTPSLLKSYILYSLEELLGEEHVDGTPTDERLRVLDKKAEGRRYVCFVDAVDQIYGNKRELYIDLPALCPNIFWVFSALSDFPVESALSAYRYKTVTVDGLYKEQIEKIISATAGKRGKKLDSEVSEMIRGRKGADNPLFLSLVLQRFFMMNKKDFEAADAIASGMEGLHRYMQEMLAEMPDLPDRMATYILNVTAGMFDQRQFNEVLMLIATSKGGLTENELSDILSLEGTAFSQIGFQQTVSYLYDAFSQRSNGKWTFVHRLFGEAVLSEMSEEDRRRISDLFIRYSMADSDFLEREGFYYLLDAKDERFERVLRQALKWETLSEVSSEICCLVRDREDYREFFVELTKKYPSDSATEFWLALEDYIYGIDVEKTTYRIVRILFDSESVSDKYKWQLALRSLYRAPKEEGRGFIDLAFGYIRGLSEPELSEANAGIYTELVRVLTATDSPYGEIVEARSLAVEYIHRAISALGDSGEWKRFKELFRYFVIICRNASSWNSPDTLELWQMALKALEGLDRFRDEEDYVYRRVVLLYSLCKTYCKKQFRNYEKAKEYGDEALQLADRLLNEKPTVYNLDAKRSAVYAYTERLKEEYQYPYLEKAVECSKRIYATTKNDDDKKELAYAEGRYACAAAKAINTRAEEYKSEMIAEVDRIFDHCFQLYEEFESEGKLSLNDRGTYSAYLADRAELYRERGYFERAVLFAKRSLELLGKFKKETLEKAEKAKTEEMKSYEYEGVNWCNGWLARVKGTLADIHMSQLSLEECEKCAEEAFELSLERSKSISAYYRRAVENLLLCARARYYQRRDNDALETCDRLSEIMSAPEAEKYDTSLYKGEENYIRSRIALERGDTDRAWQYYLECEKCPEKYLLYHDRLLILRADILTAKGDEESNIAWLRALRRWRSRFESERQRFEKDDEYKIYTSKGKVLRRAYRRESCEYAISAYYMAYCYYNYVSEVDSKEALSEIEGGECTPIEDYIFDVLTLVDRGKLNAIRPKWIPVPEIKETEDKLGMPSVSNGEEVIATVLEMTDKDRHKVNKLAYPLVTKHCEYLEKAICTAEQHAALCDVISIMQDDLGAERVALEDAVKNTEAVRKAFRFKDMPVACRQVKGWRVWSAKEIGDRVHRWRALMMLILFALKCESLDDKERKRLNSRVLWAYRSIAALQCDSIDLSKADMSLLSDGEICGLISVFTMEAELRNRAGFRYWYDLKNSWVTEMYARSGDMKYITHRLEEFEEFITDRYEEIYQGYVLEDKKDMAFEISHAAMNLIQVLADRGFTKEAFETAKWFESVPKLRGKMSTYTINVLCTDNEKDRLWLEKLKTEYCAKWLDVKDFWLLKTI